MFDNNDRFLKIASTFLKIAIWFLAIGGVLAFFIMLIIDEDLAGVGFAIMAISCIFAIVLWVFGNLYLSLICDIKLIRNKLYNTNNFNTDIFLSTEDKYKIQSGIKQKEEKIKRYKELLEKNLISKEEYDAEIAKLN